MNWNRIVIAPVFPFWVILILLFLGLVLTVVQYWMIQKRIGRAKAIQISLLRLITLLLLVSFSVNPSFIVRKEEKIIPALAILVDRSQSMSLSGQGGKKTRLDDAKALLLDGEKPLLKALQESFEVKLYTMGGSLQAIGESELPGLNAAGKRADLNGALEKLGSTNSLLLLLSDGNVDWNGSDRKAPPLIAVPMGDPRSYRDISIKEIKAPPIAFRGRPVQIEVVIKSHGYSGITVPVILRNGAKILTAKNFSIRRSPEEGVTSFSFTPEDVGSFPLSVSIPPQFGESLTSNNDANIALKVYRDKIRILMVSGSPSLNYRYMRSAFKNDPTIDLLSFVILRTPANIINVPLQEQSLIPFPVETLFINELKNFDLVIFDDFFYRPYLNLSHLEHVKEFVRGGGSFAVIGGPNFFGQGGYEGTPLEEILPARLSGKEDYRRDLPSGVTLSRLGMIHPITRFSSEGNNHQGLWHEMPPLDGINLLEAKSSGRVLLESTDGIPRPILVVGNYGKGRVLILGT
ncbi:MAG TPA: glutamine amidotransferase, partial [Thermodesulfobacteriota bacterium]|nr:glutamine amidotransferase [Thermodesulfobacteriota bacterium]